MSLDAVPPHFDDTRSFTQAIADALAAGREFAVWIESDAGDTRLAYTVRCEAGAYRVRDADLSDVGTFVDLGAAVSFGGRYVERLA